MVQSADLALAAAPVDAAAMSGEGDGDDGGSESGSNAGDREEGDGAAMEARELRPRRGREQGFYARIAAGNNPQAPDGWRRIPRQLPQTS